MSLVLCDKNPCSNDIVTLISECANIKLGNVVEIGKGTFGKVYRADLIGDGLVKEIAVKKVNFQEEEFDLIENEVILSKFMSDQGIGPTYYYSFFVKTTNCMEKEKENKNMFDATLYMFIDRYDMDCSKAFDSFTFDSVQRIYILEQMINLIRKQLYELQIACVDVKPSNFLLNKSTLEVRMIDFGAGSCLLKFSDSFFNKYGVETINIYYIVILVQISLFINDDILWTFIEEDPVYKYRSKYYEILKDDDLSNYEKEFFNFRHYFDHYIPNVNSDKFLKLIFSGRYSLKQLYNQLKKRTRFGSSKRSRSRSLKKNIPRDI